MADRIVVLNAGRIEQVGAPLELYHNPVNRFVAAFLGAPRMNFFGGRVADVGETAASVDVAGLPRLAFSSLVKGHGLVAGAEVTVGVRPEKLGIGAGAGPVRADGQLRLCERLGRESVLYVDAGDLVTTGSETGTGDVTLVHASSDEGASGSRITFGFDIADAYLFGPDGRTLTGAKPL